jgi:hypothetical protein
VCTRSCPLGSWYWLKKNSHKLGSPRFMALYGFLYK